MDRGVGPNALNSGLDFIHHGGLRGGLGDASGQSLRPEDEDAGWPWMCRTSGNVPSVQPRRPA
jgi:hypothetical protein